MAGFGNTSLPSDRLGSSMGTEFGPYDATILGVQLHDTWATGLSNKHLLQFMLAVTIGTLVLALVLVFLLIRANTEETVSPIRGISCSSNSSWRYLDPINRLPTFAVVSETGITGKENLI